MSDKAESWVWGYEKNVIKFCEKYFPQHPQTAKDTAHEVLLRLSQKSGLDRVGDRSSWIRTVAKRECMDYFRELKRRSGGKDGQFERHCCGYCGLAFGSMAEIKEHIKENPEHNEGLRCGAVHQAGPRPDYHLPRGDDDDSGVESEAELEDVENETDESEKIDPEKFWRTFKRHDPDRAAALKRSLFFVAQAFGSIKLARVSLDGAEQVAKLRAVLQDAKQRVGKICGTFADQAFQDFEKTLAALRDARQLSEKEQDTITQFNLLQCAASVKLEREDAILKKLVEDAREVIRSVEAYLLYAEKIGLTTSRVERDRELERVPEIPDEENNSSRSFKIFHFTDFVTLSHKEFDWSGRRILAFVRDDPDPLHVLYSVWNRILRKGRKGKYGNRKLLKVLLFAFKKMTAGREDFDIFDSLTEETNFETLRVMSYRLNKGYSDLADFIYRKSIRPPKRKAAPASEKKPAAPASHPPRPT